MASLSITIAMINVLSKIKELCKYGIKVEHCRGLLVGGNI